MKQWIKYTLPVAMGLVTLTASADTIRGTIQMSGNVALDTDSLYTATTASFDNSVTLLNPSGGAGSVSSGTLSFANVPHGTGVNFKDFTFAPLANQSTPVTGLWSFVNPITGWTYSFNLLSITAESVSSQGGNDFLMMSGTGTLDIVGLNSPYIETSGNWSFTVTDSSGGTSGSAIFGFSDSNTSTPDGGMTIMMLGAALTGLGMIKRKLA